MTKSATYQELSEELETILATLQREDIDVDAAMEQYERGLEIVHKLEKYLQTAENRVQALQAKFQKEA
jgi:exodeoxyribonuclease VII small subunit